MKLTNFIFGILIFSVVMTLMFASVQSYLSKNEIGDASEWEALAADYNKFGGAIVNKTDSGSSQIKGETDLGIASTEGSDTSIVKGAISGGKLTFSFYKNFQDVVNKVSNDVGGNFINQQMINIVLALAFVFLILVGLHFIRGFKTEV